MSIPQARNEAVVIALHVNVGLILVCLSGSIAGGAR
jgi:hypothetical protein